MEHDKEDMIMLDMLIAAALSFANAQAAQVPADSQTIVPIATTIIRGDRQGIPDARGGKRPCIRQVGKSTIALAKARDGRIAVGFDWDPAWAGAVYDHDRDGRIDHLVYPIGLLPFAPEGGSTEAQFRLGYWQAVDTDHDGSADTLVTPAQLRPRGWFSGWVMVTGTPATGGPRCTVIDAAGRVIEPCTLTENTGPNAKEYAGTTAKAVVRPMDVSDISAMWSEMQQASRACELTAADLPP